MRFEIKRRLYIAVGITSLVLGIIGIPLPLLPTTPFLLLSAFCFSQSSQRFHDWLVSHPVLGMPIRDWRENQAISLGGKFLSTSMMAGSYAMLLFFPGVPYEVRVGYPLLVLPVLVFIWTRNGRSRS